MYLTKELFIIPERNDKFIAYAPLKGVAMSVNSGAIAMLQRINKGEQVVDDSISQFLERGIVLEEPEAAPENKFIKKTSFQPTAVTIMPTSDCNLRCVYCYGNGGYEPSCISEEVAMAAINEIIRNAVDLKTGNVHVTFHGGGEPLHYKTFGLVTSVAEYAKSESKRFGLSKPKFSTGTNGLLARYQLEWIRENISHLTLSFDGPREIHDRQRPTENGNGSYDHVVKSMKFFDENNITYGVRATITRDSVHRMVEIVDLLNEISATRSYHFEPLYEVGRTAESKYISPEPEDFSKGLFAARMRAQKLGKRVGMSCGTAGELRDKFCGAAGLNFCVTQDSDVTTCYEVMRRSDHRTKDFFIGGYNHENQKFDFDLDKISNLAHRTVTNMDSCKDCYAKYNCGGGCLAKVVTNKSLFDSDGYFKCDINRSHVLDSITELLNTEGGENE